jgi:CDP-glycerol glycerophosphotransferase
LSREQAPDQPDSPVLSVVLVAHREQAYLTGCLRSVLDHRGRDVEVVAVDNGSPDHVPEILRELAEDDDRVVVQRLDPPVEHGSARAAGIAAAKGDYVWLVDTTDRLEPGAVAAVIDAATSGPADVFYVDYRFGRLTPRYASPHAGVVRRVSERGGANLDATPDLLALATATWSLVVRRELLTGWGIDLTGARSEVSFAYRALLAAQDVSVVPGVWYRRLSPPNAVRLPEIHGDESDLADEFETVFRFLADKAPELDARRRLVPGRMVGTATWRLNRMEREERRQFARKLTRTIARNARPDDKSPRGKVPSLRMRLVRGDHPFLYRSLEWYLRSRESVTEWAKDWPAQVSESTLPMRYWLWRRLPLHRDLAVFGAYWFGAYACNPRAVYEKLREIAPHIRGVWVVREGVEVPEGVDFVTEGSPEYFRLIARAKYYVNNVGFPDDWYKRPGMVLVHTHHGTPLKRMGIDQNDNEGENQHPVTQRELDRWERWDYSLSSNRLSTLVWERVYPAPYETLEYGYPRNDRLVNATAADVGAARRALGVPEGARALLWAPTHREYEKKYRPLLDVERLAQALGPDWVVLSRAHYSHDTGRPVSRSDDGRVIDVTGHPSIEELCLAADVLATDYSSVMFDYAVLDRPVVIFAPDWETYRFQRGTYFDLMSEAPGVVCRTEEQLADTLASGSYGSDVATKARALFRSKFCAWDKGDAAERVVRRVFLGG